MSLPDALPPLSYDEALNGPPPETGELLDNVASAIRRFVVVSPEQLDAISLWVLHTYVIESADTTPYLSITSAEKQSGKSRLLEVLAQLAARTLEAANISDAALFRVIGGDEGPPATILFDEIDAVFGPKQASNKEELRGLINAGYRNGAKAWRCAGEGASLKATAFPVFGAKALAGIGELPDTIADRSVPIRLRRRAKEEKVARGRYRDIRAASIPLAKTADYWARLNAEQLKEARPDLPQSLSDRAMDCAEPLLAIADLAAGEWGKRSRDSLVALFSDREGEEPSWGIRLLADIRSVFEEDGEDRLSSHALLDGLKADEEAPWGTWGKAGTGLNARALGKLLHPYGVSSRSIRLPSGETPKGYMREWFEDPWMRYLPRGVGDLSATSATSALASQKQDLFYPPQEGDVADTKEASNPHSNAVVAGVADGNANGGPADPVEEAEAERLAAKFDGVGQ